MLFLSSSSRGSLLIVHCSCQIMIVSYFFSLFIINFHENFFFTAEEFFKRARLSQEENILARRGLEIEDFTCKNVSFFLNQRRNSIDEQDEIHNGKIFTIPQKYYFQDRNGGKERGRARWIFARTPPIPSLFGLGTATAGHTYPDPPTSSSFHSVCHLTH